MSIQFDQPCSSSSWSQPSNSIPSCSLSTTMKDVQSSSSKHSRNQIYPRKRPSPHGVSKSQKSSPLQPALTTTRKSPRTSRVDQLARRERDAQIAALRRQGVYLEEEYRDEIRHYMHDMEVSRSGLIYLILTTHLFFRDKQCLQLNQWTNSQRLDGTCVPASSISSSRFISHSGFDQKHST